MITKKIKIQLKNGLEARPVAVLVRLQVNMTVVSMLNVKIRK